MTDNNENKLIYLISKIKHARNPFEYIFTDFITPEFQSDIKYEAGKEGFKCFFYGGLSGFESAVAALSKDGEEPEPEEYPISIFKIAASSKFESLTHRDYLGAILSLGVKREKLGDINVFDDGAEIYIKKEISDYIRYNFEKIKHTPVRVTEILPGEARKKIQEFKLIEVSVASDRLDTFIAALLKLSREKSAEAIKSGLVKINHVCILQRDKAVNEGDILSIKGYGRFSIGSFVRYTKSDRIVYEVKKYI